MLTRQPAGNLLINDDSAAAENVKASRKQYDESSVKVVGATDFAIQNPTMKEDVEMAEPDMSIEEKLQEMHVEENGSQPSTKRKTDKGLVPSAGSLQTVLTQALHANDRALLEACLEHNKPEVIQTTVQRVPTAYIIPLLNELIARFQESPNRASRLMVWIRIVLMVHTTYLMTVPDLVYKLSSFYQALDVRLSVFPKLLALQGRLDLIQNQIEIRSKFVAEQEGAEHAQNVYVEEDSDDDAERESDDEELDGFMSGAEDDASEDEDDDDLMDQDEQDDDEDEEEDEDY